MSRLRKDLRAISADGAAASVMVGLGETYLPAFVLALTANQVASGLIATLPMFLGALVQSISPYVVRHWRSYQRWVVVCAVVQATIFLPLVAAAWKGAMPTLAVFIVASIYWGMGMAGGSSWNTWIGPLVPSRIHARYFARRTVFSQLAQALAFVLGGVSLELSASWGEPLRPFALVFLVAAGSRYLSAWLLSVPSEPCPPGKELVTLDLGQLWARVRQDRIGRMLLYMLAVQSSVQIAGPYFTPYMLRHLGFSYWQYVELICAAYLAKVVAMPWLGQLIERWGAKRLLWICGLAIAPSPALWLISDRFSYLLGLQILSGAAWGGFELCMLLLLFGTIPRQQRVSILTMFNLANASAVLAGSLAGGALLSAMNASPQAYWSLFAISTLARFAALGLVVRIPWQSRPATVSAAGSLVLHTRLGSREPAGVATKGANPGPHWHLRTDADPAQADCQSSPVSIPLRPAELVSADAEGPLRKAG